MRNVGEQQSLRLLTAEQYINAGFSTLTIVDTKGLPDPYWIKVNEIQHNRWSGNYAEIAFLDLVQHGARDLEITTHDPHRLISSQPIGESGLTKEGPNYPEGFRFTTRFYHPEQSPPEHSATPGPAQFQIQAQREDTGQPHKDDFPLIVLKGFGVIALDGHQDGKEQSKPTLVELAGHFKDDAPSNGILYVRPVNQGQASVLNQ